MKFFLAGSELNVVLENSGVVIITDICGRQLYASEMTEGINKINVSNLHDGVYILKADGKVSKFIKR